MPKTKVYSGYSFVQGKQVSVLIATTSWKKAAEAYGHTASQIRPYWSLTSNKEDIEVAVENWGTPMVKLDEWAVNPEYVTLEECKRLFE